MQAEISAIEYYLPETTVTTESLSREFPEWPVQKIDDKTGIRERHVAGPGECASDLAAKAAQKLFESGACRPEEIDYVLFCTQSPDYYLPTTACVLQDRLGIPVSAGALDFNLGCSGYVYGLGLAQGLIASGQASKIRLLTAETYSKFLNPADRGVRTIFGDGAAATLISAKALPQPAIGPFLYGTDGKGAPNLIVPAGGMRLPHTPATAEPVVHEDGAVRSQEQLFMNGGEIFTFTLEAVPRTVACLLEKAGLQLADVELFVFHQANKYMLEHLRRRLRIPEEKFQITMAHCGNTVSSTIPIALKHASRERALPDGAVVMLVGFGVGYSWAATLLRWHPLF